MEVEFLNNFEEYENFIKKRSFFHSINYKKAIEKTFGFKSKYLVAKENNEIKGILPLFECYGKLISLPFSTEGGLFYTDEEARDLLIEKAIDIVKEEKLSYLELRQISDFDNKYGLKRKDYYLHMVLRIKNQEDMWNDFDKKLRNAIRKSEEMDIVCDNGLYYFDDFYRIFKKNMRDLGTPVDSKKFFKNLIEECRNDIDIIVAKKNKKVIAAIFLLKYRDFVKSEWASSDRKYFGDNAMQACYWHALKTYCKDYKFFDFGRSVRDEGTYNFKKKFNAKEVKLHYKYFLAKGIEMPSTLKTDFKRKLFVSVWRKLPLFITDLIGPFIRKRFP